MQFGALIGIFLFGNGLKYIYSKFYVPTCFCFIGLILGSLKLVYKQANVSKIKFTHILTLILTFSLGLYFINLENVFVSSNTTFSISYLIICGIFMSAGIVIPGVSKTVILMILGIYEIYLSAITSLNFLILFPLGIGLIIGGLIFLVLMQFLFANLKSYTYFAIIGFVLSSIFVIYPGLNFDTTGLVSILVFTISFFISLKCSSYAK